MYQLKIEHPSTEKRKGSNHTKATISEVATGKDPRNPRKGLRHQTRNMAAERWVQHFTSTDEDEIPKLETFSGRVVDWPHFEKTFRTHATLGVGDTFAEMESRTKAPPKMAKMSQPMQEES